MTMFVKQTCEMMCSTAGFHCNHTGWQARNKFYNALALHTTAQDNLTDAIDACPLQLFFPRSIPKIAIRIALLLWP